MTRGTHVDITPVEQAQVHLQDYNHRRTHDQEFIVDNRITFLQGLKREASDAWHRDQRPTHMSLS